MTARVDTTGNRLRLRATRRSTGRVGDGGGQVGRGGRRAGGPADHPGTALQQPERRCLAQPRARQPFQSRAHQGRTDRGRHRRGELARVCPGRSTISGLWTPGVQICAPVWSPVANMRTQIQPNGWEYGPLDVASILLLGGHRRESAVPRGSADPTAASSDSLIPQPIRDFGSRGPCLSLPSRCPG